MPRFIAIDPSTTFTGWSIFQDQGLVAWGNIDARKHPTAERFVFIIGQLSSMAEKYGAQEVVIEDVSYAWHSKNRNRNIAGLQIVFSSIKDWSKRLDLPFTAVNPATWKNAVVGHANATKEITKNNVLLRFPNLPDDLTDHEYDAVAIGVYHAAVAAWGDL